MTGLEPGEPAVTTGPRVVIRRVVRDPASVLLTVQLTTAAVAFFVNIVAARTMGPAGRGELALLLQIAYMSSVGLLLGSDRSVVAVFSGRPVRVVTRSFVRLLTIPSTVCLAVTVAVLAVPIPGTGSWQGALALALLFAVTNAFVRAVRSIAIASGQQREFLGYGLVLNGLLVLAIGLLFVLGIDDSTTWMLAYLLTGTVPTAVWLVRWARREPSNRDRGAPPQVDLRQSRREGLQILPSAVSQSGVLRLDRLLLAGLASTTALGIYATVGTMTELLAWPLVAFADSRLGAWREAYDRGALRVRNILLLASAYCLVAAVLMVLAVRFLLLPLLGPAYRPAEDLVIPLVAAAAVFGLGRLLVSMLIAARRNLHASAVEVLGLGVGVVGYVVLIDRYGALGAAYGSLLSYFTCLAIAGILLVRVRRSR